jgi:SWI/SNF-related matrix-associated actin-dependent regulator 1 of chromatin subfamily A
VLFAEASWVPAENSQAAMRCHRIGQTEPVQVYFASLAGSIDEAVMEVVRRKTEDISQIVTV